MLAAALLAAACGGKKGDNADTLGDGGESGTADAGGIEPPPAQGAMAFSVKAPSPAPPGKSCPTASAFTTELPPNGGLDGDTYLANIVDGEGTAAVSCRVTGSSPFELSGQLTSGGRGLLIEGTLSADQTGVGRVTVVDSEHLSSPLVGSSCTLSAQKGVDDKLQLKPGSVWGRFSCPAVEAAPSTLCGADGFFVLENCEQ